MRNEDCKDDNRFFFPILERYADAETFFNNSEIIIDFKY